LVRRRLGWSPSQPALHARPGSGRRRGRGWSASAGSRHVRPVAQGSLAPSVAYTHGHLACRHRIHSGSDLDGVRPPHHLGGVPHVGASTDRRAVPGLPARRRRGARIGGWEGRPAGPFPRPARGGGECGQPDVTVVKAVGEETLAGEDATWRAPHRATRRHDFNGSLERIPVVDQYELNAPRASFNP
jgi:hypothetical protein